MRKDIGVELTAGKRLFNASNVVNHSKVKVIWRNTDEFTLAKDLSNVNNVARHLISKST
jgi:hypothetical protein